MLLSYRSSTRYSDYDTAPRPYTMKDFFLEGGRYYEDGKLTKVIDHLIGEWEAD